MKSKYPIQQSLDYVIKTRDWKAQVIGDMPISRLISRIDREETIEIDYDLSYFDLTRDGFDTDDLYSFIEHFKLVQNADLKYPIILSHKGQILDGRHRICKAIINGQKTIKAIMFIKDQGINFCDK